MAVRARGDPGPAGAGLGYGHWSILGGPSRLGHADLKEEARFCLQPARRRPAEPVHPDQLTVPAATVRALVDTQFPAWRELPIRRVAAQGTVNAIFRVGDRLAARFPLVPRDVGSARAWLAAEAAAARELAGRTRFRTPEPVALGEPGAGYPLPWSVQTWLPGTVATDEDPGGVGRVRPRPGRVHPGRPGDRHRRAGVRRHRPGRRPARPRRLAGDLLRAQRAAAGRPAAAPGVGADAGAAPRTGRRRDEPRRPHPRQRARPRRAAGRRPRRRRPRSGRPRAGPGRGLAPARARPAAGACGTGSGSPTSTGSAAGPGRSCRRWARSGTTWTATRR